MSHIFNIVYYSVSRRRNLGRRFETKQFFTVHIEANKLSYSD